MHLLATLFIEPIRLTGWPRLALMLPLCLSIAVIYKTIKCAQLRQVPLACLALWLTILAGMALVGVVLLVGYELLR